MERQLQKHFMENVVAKLTLMLIPFILGCNSDHQQEIKVKPDEKQKSYLSGYPEMAELLNKNNITQKGNSWKLIQSSDSTCKIQWLSNHLVKEGKEEYDFYFARQFHLV